MVLTKLRSWSGDLSLARRFMLTSLIVLLAEMLIIGWWTSRQIEYRVVDETSGMTALYVNSFIAPRLQVLAGSSSLDAQGVRQLDALMAGTPLGQRIVAFKVWTTNGLIVYSTSRSTVGSRPPPEAGFYRAVAGQVDSRISDLQDEENVEERKHWSRLLETYAPVRLAGTGEVIAVAEFYQTVDELAADLKTAQMESWAVVVACTVAMYLLLARLVKHGSDTIVRQQAQLRQKVTELSVLLTRNAELDRRVRRAAARTTELNERFLRRVSADLHDGPAQEIGLALLRLDGLVEQCEQCQLVTCGVRQPSPDLTAIREALQSALRELRAVSGGLVLPELEALTPAQAVTRAVQEHARKVGAKVELAVDGVTDGAALPVKMALYRLAQEALTNAYRHAGDAATTVRMWSEGSDICLEVRDEGPGFEPKSLPSDRGNLGLAGMRDRVQVLGGTFVVESQPGRGTRVVARVPKEVPDG